MKNISIIILLFCCQIVWAKENNGLPPAQAPKVNGKTAADCEPAQEQLDMEINNIRARLLTGGDLWWDPVAQIAHYEVPKVPRGSDEPIKNSLYAGALWIGGIDDGGQLKVAAQTYRQSGNDFWPGVLDNNGEVSNDICEQYDRFFTVFGNEIDDARAKYEANGGNPLSSDQVPENVLKWPGRNNPHFDDFELPFNKNLAPFFDSDADGKYDPTKGDYPVISSDCGAVYADQMIWWVFNDKGNVHLETGGEAIGLEIGALAFAYATNDELNNMTFYKYVVDNKSTVALDSTFFGQWVDPDLGEYTDDYVGCVPQEGLGIVYNCDNNDGTYGSPPMLGVDFFKGPSEIADADGDGDIDTVQLGMSAFTYYNNDFTVTGNPENASHFYGYMAGVWKDGTPFTFGGNGYGGTESYAYQFPSDPTDTSPEAWSECSVGNSCNDRRFMQASGPFRLEPGAVNDVIIGVSWMPEVGGCPSASFNEILRADKKAQALFENCFKLKDGPDAPDLAIRELDREIILTVWNDSLISNNAFEQYEEVDPVLRAISEIDTTVTEISYKFQGYKIYQLRDANVASAELSDFDKARLIALVDLKDGVKTLINYVEDKTVDELVPQLKVEGLDNGIKHTFQIEEDQFATSEENKNLVNNKRYYFMTLAYAYNAHRFYKDYPDDVNAQKEPYLEGRKNIKKYVAIPHIPKPQAEGITLTSKYGDGPEVTTTQGYGNGSLSIELTPESEAEALQEGTDYRSDKPRYLSGKAPITIKVHDPFTVANAKFELELSNSGTNTILSDASKWVLRNLTAGGEIVARSETTIRQANEQPISDANGNSLGFTITVEQTPPASGTHNGFISVDAIFENPQNIWVSLFPDSDQGAIFNWIRSGDADAAEASDNALDPTDYNTFYDPDGFYEEIAEGAIAPYCLTNNDPGTGVFANVAPACTDCTPNITSGDPENTLADMASVDIVMTSDVSKWTRCAVIEMGNNKLANEGYASKNGLRHHAALKADGSDEDPLAATASLQPNTIYYVGGTSASTIQYTKSDGSIATIGANRFFRADDITTTTGFTANNGAKIFSSDRVGYSYFPGYAINIANGERLNVIFSENSFLGNDNGKDMIWNPSSRIFTNALGANALRLGGMHFIYVMKTKYDEGRTHHDKLVQYEVDNDIEPKADVYRDAMWVALPFTRPTTTLNSWQDGIVPTNMRIKIRTSHPYSQEDNNPSVKYEFDMSPYAPRKAQLDTAASAMDLIRVVPNPYYAFSTYETGQLDNRVRITNLPSRATVSVLTMEGALVKTLKIDNFGKDTAEGNVVGEGQINSLDWDITNEKGIPLASGIYLIHISAPELGEERTLKWFCIRRPIDLDIF